MKVVANSLPKSGTHLLTRLLSLLAFQENALHLSGSLTLASARNPIKCYAVRRRILSNGEAGRGVCVALDEPEVFLRSDWLANRLKRLPDRIFMEGHLPYSATLEKLLLNEGCKVVFIIRDPRDVLVSFCNHIFRDPDYNPFHDYFRSLCSEEDRLIAGLNRICLGKHTYGGLVMRLQRVMGWFCQSSACVVRFEELIGTRGGGSDEKQKVAIKKIADYLGCKIDDEDLGRIASRVFYRGASTFFKGVIGSWEQSFTSAVKDAFKEKCGKYLIDLDYERNGCW